MDWLSTFYPVSHVVFDPYSVRTFMNPPWAALLLYPFHFLSSRTGMTIDAVLIVVTFAVLVLKRGGRFVSLLLTLTSFPLVSTWAWGNIEWMVALGFIFANAWSLPLAFIKPQSGLLACIAWAKQSNSRLLFFAPLAVVIVLSFFVWGNWIVAAYHNVKYVQAAGMSTWNASPFPLLVPVGLLLLVYLLFDQPAEPELFGVAATLCLSPYFAYQSLSVPFALLSASHKKLAFMVWLLLWIVPFWSRWRAV